MDFIVAMEKFAKWNDPANLINPFAPTTITPSVTQYLFGTILLLIRLPFLLVITILLFLITMLTTIPMGPITRLLRVLFEAPLARLLLLCLGYWSINTTYIAANKLRIRKSKNPTKTRPNPVGSCVQRGDVVVCTATSPIEILYLTWMFAPTFAHVLDTSAKNAVPQEQTASVEEKGLWGSLSIFSSMRIVPSTRSTDTTAQPKTLKEVANQNQGLSGSPICTFPEGVCSNGTGVLMFHPIFNNFTFEQHRIHLLTFQHATQKSSKFNATLPIGSALKSLLWHCMHWSHTMKISMLPALELNAPPLIESEEVLKSKREAQVRREVAARASAGKYGGGILPSIAMPDPGIMGNRCRDLLAKMYGIDTLTRCSKDYETFLEFWRDENKKKK